MENSDNSNYWHKEAIKSLGPSWQGSIIRKYARGLSEDDSLSVCGITRDIYGQTEIKQRKLVPDIEEALVTITKEEYDNLLNASTWLECLEDAGVDNWEGIGEAWDLLEQYKGRK